MTLINLVSGWRYADPRKPKERMQYIAVALVFLFLLYRCASAVVLYWTLSQALSLVRSEVFFRKGAGASNAASGSMDIAGILPSFVRYAALFLLVFSCILFADAFALGDVAQLDVFRAFQRLSTVGGGTLAAAAVLCVASIGFRTSFDPQRLPVGFRICLLAEIVLAIPLALIRWGGLPSGGSEQLSWLRDMGPSLLVIGAALLLVLGAPSAFCHGDGDQCSAWVLPKPSWWLVLPAVCIPAQISLCSPICVLATFPAGAYGVSAWGLLGRGVILTAVVALVAWGLWLCLPAWGRKPLLFLAWMAFVMVFIYGNLLPADYGVLFHGVFSKPGNMHVGADPLLREAAILAVAVLAIPRILSALAARPGAVRWVMSLILASFFLRTAVALPKVKSSSEPQSATLSNTPVFRFSQTGTNTVFVLLDCFVGRQIGIILERRPDLKAELDGFVWYPNAISAGPVTFPNIPSIVGGMEYTPYNIAKSGLTLGQGFDRSFASYQSAIHSKGYRFACTDIFRRFYNISTNGIDTLFNESDPGWNAYGRREHGLIPGAAERSLDQIALRGNALLRSVPLAFRPAVYADGTWNVDIPDSASFAPFSFLDALPRFSEVTDDPAGLYAHIHNESTHYPSWTPVRGQLVDGDPNDCFEWALSRVVEWMRWMKESGIYDNTRIVLCSDHGTHVPNFDPSVRNMGNIWKVADWAINYFPLLMVKDAAAHGEIRRDNAFKTVSHGAYFALESPKFSEPVHEYIPSMVNTVVPTGWRNWTHYDTFFSFRIVNDPSDGANWSRIEE